VIKLATSSFQSYMVMTDSLESKAVLSASGPSTVGMFKSPVNEMKFALKNITMAEHNMVFAMKKNFRTR
jgi:hypothetical protein